MELGRDPGMIPNVSMAGYLAPRPKVCEKKHSAAGEQRAETKRR